MIGLVKRRFTDTIVKICDKLNMVGMRKDRNRPKKYKGKVIRQDMIHLRLIEDTTLDIQKDLKVHD